MNKRALIGRKIIAVDWRSWTDPNGKHSDPVFTLDNGRRVYFVVTETDHGGSYGIETCITERSK